jgi:hypothetical protein
MTEAHLKLAVLRSEALFNFYSAERRRGLSPIEANENMAIFAKRFDNFEAEQAAVAREMERSDV